NIVEGFVGAPTQQERMCVAVYAEKATRNDSQVVDAIREDVEWRCTRGVLECAEEAMPEDERAPHALIPQVVLPNDVADIVDPQQSAVTGAWKVNSRHRSVRGPLESMKGDRVRALRRLHAIEANGDPNIVDAAQGGAGRSRNVHRRDVAAPPPDEGVL